MKYDNAARRVNNMYLKKIGFTLIVMIFIFGCTESYKGFAEPKSENTMLVIGQVIVEDKGFTENPQVYRENLRIGIYGLAEDGTEIGEWARTDSNGYFVLANVPKGEYAIKAIQLTVGAGQLLTIENRLGFSDEPYIITNREFFIFEGGYFPFEPVGKIQSLKHHIFTLDQSNRNILMVRNMALFTLKNYELHNGDILTARTGGTIGKTYLVKDISTRAVFASYLIRVVPSPQIKAEYLKLFLESPLYWQQLIEKSSGTGQPNVNSTSLRSLVVSLPSFAEQHRIVAKVDQLMTLCVQLETRLTSTQHAGEALLASVVKTIHVGYNNRDIN